MMMIAATQTEDFSLTSCFVVNVFKDDPHYLNQGQDQSSKCQRAHMVSKK